MATSDLERKTNMTQLLDTEGAPIPSDDPDGRPLFDADLCDWNDGKGPILTVNVPIHFEALGGTYDSEGFVSAPLKDVLEEYLRDFTTTDDGDGVDDFSAWLQDYADRLKKATVRSDGP